MNRYAHLLVIVVALALVACGERPDVASKAKSQASAPAPSAAANTTYRATLAEGIAFAEKAGLDVERGLDVISKGAAQSWQMENRGKTMNADKFDFGFAVDWMRKDLGICLAEADRNGARLPVTALVDQFYADVQALGGQRWDTSSLVKRLR